MSEIEGSEAVALLSRLHAHKNTGYGNAWRKRGELIAIFPNLARKYDRLVVALDQGTESCDERTIDTAGDLCVYAGKYLTWLAEAHPDAFDTASSLGATEAADDGGNEPLDRVLNTLEVSRTEGVEESWRDLKAAFEPLDTGLVAEAEHRKSGLDPERKVELAWQIAAASAGLLVALAKESPGELAEWRGEIEAMG